MSREIYVPLGESGLTSLYLRRRDAAGRHWNAETAEFEEYDADNLATYGASADSETPHNELTEIGTTGEYFGDDPASGAGTWSAYRQTGEAPAESDTCVATGVIAAPAVTVDTLSAAAIAAIWAAAQRTLTMTAAQVADALTGDNLTIVRGDTLTVTFTGLSLAGATKIWFTLKTDVALADSRALLQVTADGLQILNGSSAESSLASLVISEDDTAVTLTVHGTATAALPVSKQGPIAYDVQILTADGHPVTVTSGYATVRPDVTRATA